ncbi:MAG: acyltransferase [Ferruginibacter sp.]
MGLKLLKLIYKLINTPFLFLKVCYRYLFHYLGPNAKKLLLKEVIINGNAPRCNQKTFFSGLGKIEIGSNCKFGFKPGGFFRGGSIEFQARSKNARIFIGENISTNNNIFICAVNFVRIGSKTLIGQYVTIIDHEAHGIDPDKRNQIGEIGRVEIGNNVWIGNNVTILKNSEIGDNTIVATGAIVTGKFPANVIIGGVPAKIIREL